MVNIDAIYYERAEYVKEMKEYLQKIITEKDADRALKNLIESGIIKSGEQARKQSSFADQRDGK